MENRLFSHRIHLNQFLLPPILLTSSLQSYPRSTPFLFPLKKRAYIYNTTAKRLKQDTISQGRLPYIKDTQDNVIGALEFQEQTKKSDIYWFPLSGVSQKSQVNSHNIYAENLV